MACDGCRKRKIRCDDANPCHGCVAIGISCTHELPRVRKGPKKSREVSAIAELKNHKKDRSFIVDPGKKEELSWDVVPRDSLEHTIKRFFNSQHIITRVLKCEDILKYLDYCPTPVTYSLVFAVAKCGIIFTDLRLIESYQILGERLFEEATRPKKRDEICEEALLANYFLFLAYFNKENFQVSLLYMRESLTILQILGLDQEKKYKEMDSVEDAHRFRKLFFVMFLTERGVSLLTNFPLTLKNSIAYPDCSLNDPSTNAVITLSKLYSVVDDYLLVLGDSEMSNILEGSVYQKLEKSKELSEQIQTDVERTEFLINTEWLRLLVWQAFNPGTLNRDLIRSIAHSLLELGKEISSADLLRVYGVGMVMKLSTILFSFADAIGMRSLCDEVVSDEHDTGKRTKRLLDLITTLAKTKPELQSPLRIRNNDDKEKIPNDREVLPPSQDGQPFMLSSALFGNAEFFLDMFSTDLPASDKESSFYYEEEM